MSDEGQQRGSTIYCEACGTGVPASDVVHYGSIEQGYRELCTRCLNAEMAHALGLDLIRSRTGEGRARAKARGVKMGRKPKLTPHQHAEAIRRKDGGEAVREIARTFDVHHSTISRL
jgi:DNA invertase Pin-like site-specific DNA recombinase